MLLFSTKLIEFKGTLELIPEFVLRVNSFVCSEPPLC